MIVTIKISIRFCTTNDLFCLMMCTKCVFKWPENFCFRQFTFIQREPEGNEICYFLLKENVNIQQNLSIICAVRRKLSGCRLNFSPVGLGATPGGVSGKLSIRFCSSAATLYYLHSFSSI